MKGLDFVVIGAPKSGTTSLHKHLAHHPEVYLPREKEAPFFNKDRVYQRGWGPYARKYFGDAPAGRTWGKVTPQYMLDTSVPARLAETFPDARLVAILRHPVERAISHYKMSARRRMERRTFEDAARELLDGKPLDAVNEFRLKSPDNELYLVGSLYGHILSRYLEFFERKQFLFLFTDELEADPAAVIAKLCRFIGVADDFTPPDIDRAYHVGGLDQFVYVPRVAWKVLPKRMRRTVKFWMEQWNVRPLKNDGIPISDETSAALRALFRDDVRLLERVIGRSVPWTDLGAGTPDAARDNAAQPRQSRRQSWGTS